MKGASWMPPSQEYFWGALEPDTTEWSLVLSASFRFLG